MFVDGFNKEKALFLCMKRWTPNYEPTDEMKEAIEKVHYACLNDTPVRKKYVLMLFPDFSMDFNVPFSKLNMAEPVLEKAYKKAAEYKENEKARYKDYYDIKK